jgi:2-amino-4-hydroxy-6-hydroxymethyldihydropteridine diphosphokinase
MTNQVLIGLGSNLNSPAKQVLRAADTLADCKDVNLVALSSLYCSSPQGPQDQDDYVNAVALVETALSPHALLLITQGIEASFGRVKTRHWGERVIDLDILFFNEQVINSQNPDLTIPHPFALERDFVMIPALELVPEWRLPDHSYLKDYLSSCTSHQLHPIDNLPT